MKFTARALYISLLTSLTAFSAVLYVSCGKNISGNDNSCQAIACAHGGTCAKGSCICPAGYEGNNCEITTRDRFVGSWQVSEKGTLTPARQYQLAIEYNNTDASHVNIKNCYNYFNAPVTGYVIGDTLYIPNQQMEGKVVFGKGYYHTRSTSDTTKVISVRYEVVDTASQVVDDFGYYSDLDHSDLSDWSK